MRIARAVLDSVGTPLLVGDAHGRVLLGNRAFEDLAPGVHEALAGRDLVEVLAPECRDELMRGLYSPRPADGTLQACRVELTTAPGMEFLGIWLPLDLERGAATWLLRLAPGPALTVEALGARLRREETQKRKFAALLTVARAVLGKLDLDQVLDTIAHEARTVIEVDECVVFVLDEAAGVLAPAACDVQSFRDEVMALRLPLGQGVTGNVALTGRGEIVNGAMDDPRAVQVPGTPVEQSSLLCVPLLVRDRVAGAITLTRMGERRFEDDDLELASLFAGQCSAALVNARLYEESRRAYRELHEAQAQLVQSAKLNALGELAGGVAHDFNNILAAILGRTQLLQHQVTDPDQRRQLAVIERAALDGAQAVRRVQEFTRLRHDEDFAVLNGPEIVRDVLDLTQPAWEAESKRRGVRVEVVLDLRSDRSVSGNAAELHEVFTNLILNALDAMPGGGTLTLSTVDAGAEVGIAVSDTGMGMDAATRARLFEPFFTTKPVTGTGLGLPVADGIVARHHGRIEVESAPGQGSTFTVWLPAAAPEVACAKSASPDPVPHLRLLVVDDEEAVLQVLRDLLVLLGQEVETAQGGQAGLEHFAAGEFDAVFTDLGMPGVNGWDLVRAIRQRSPGTPVAIVTGWGVQIDCRLLLARGADYVVPKPFSLDDIAQALRHLGRRLSRAA
jgi:signal transduction histidine kinase/ActR/RegA family two-component response regulator